MGFLALTVSGVLKIWSFVVVFGLQSLNLLVRCWRTVVVTECLMGLRFGFGYLFDLWGLGVVERLAD